MLLTSTLSCLCSHTLIIRVDRYFEVSFLVLIWVSWLSVKLSISSSVWGICFSLFVNCLFITHLIFFSPSGLSIFLLIYRSTLHIKVTSSFCDIPTLLHVFWFLYSFYSTLFTNLMQTTFSNISPVCVHIPVLTYSEGVTNLRFK